MDWMFVTNPHPPPQIHVAILIPKVRRSGFGELIGIDALLRGSRRVGFFPCSPPCEDTARRRCLQPKKPALTRHRSACFPGINIWLKPPSL